MHLELEVELWQDALELLREQANAENTGSEAEIGIKPPPCPSPGEVALFLTPPLDKRLEELKTEYEGRIDATVKTFTLTENGPELLRRLLSTTLQRTRDETIETFQNTCLLESTAAEQTPDERQAWLEELAGKLVDEAEHAVREELSAALTNTGLIDLGIVALGASVLGLLATALLGHAVALIPAAVAAAQPTIDTLVAQARKLPRIVRWFNEAVAREVKTLIDTAGGLATEELPPITPEMIQKIDKLPADVKARLNAAYNAVLEGHAAIRQLIGAVRQTWDMVWENRTPEVARLAADTMRKLDGEYNAWRYQMKRLKSQMERYLPEFTEFRAEIAKMSRRAQRIGVGLDHAPERLENIAGEIETTGKLSLQTRQYLANRRSTLTKVLRNLVTIWIDKELAEEVLSEHPDLGPDEVDSVAAGEEGEISSYLDEKVSDWVDELEATPLEEIGLVLPPECPFTTLGDLLSAGGQG